MIHIEGVSKQLGEFSLEDITLDIDEQEYLIILGPTGAGKTILLELIAGIYPPEGGRVILNGRDITQLPPRKRNIGMVYQDYMLFPHLTVRKNILYGLRSKKEHEQQQEKKLRELTELLGISDLQHRYPDTLSGGEQQRVALARALIMEPKVLLLDEPLSALDSETKIRLQDELRRIHGFSRTTMIHVTHSFDEALALGDRVAIMNGGRIVQEGVPQDVFRRPNSDFVAGFLGVTNVLPGEADANRDSTSIHVDGLTITSIAPSPHEKKGPVRVSVRPEDILVSLNPIDSSARNSFRGPIRRISDTGMIVKVTVDVGVPLVAVITRRSLQDLELAEGKEVYLTFKAADVHVF